jgi:glutaminase
LSYADYDGRTALHIATNNGDSDIASMLIKAGADTQVEDNFGNLPVLSSEKVNLAIEYAEDNDYN